MINIREFGAKGSGSVLETREIQAAIDACFAQGGGTVLVPAGTYQTSTLVMKDRVTLHLERGATIKGSDKLEDYPPVSGSFVDAVGQRRTRALLYAENAEGIAIEGYGTIDGSGGAFERDLQDRPFLLRFIACRNVVVRDVTLRDSAAWVSHYLNCENVHISGVTIRSHVNGNNDGIDIDSCTNVRVLGCDIDTGDDAVCLKSTSSKPCRNIVVSNCLLKSDWGALKIGTESAGDFQDIVISNCVIYDTKGGGLKIISMDGAHIENVMVSDIIMRRVSGPIFFRLGSRLRAYQAGEEPRTTGSLKNIMVRNIQADVWEEGFPLWGNARRAGICLTGVPNHPLENLVFDNIHVKFPGGGTPEEARRHDVPELEAHYPEFTIFVPLPAYGFYVRHAREVVLSNIRLETTLPDARPALFCDDVESLELNNWRAAAPPEGPEIRTRDTANLNVERASGHPVVEHLNGLESAALSRS